MQAQVCRRLHDAVWVVLEHAQAGVALVTEQSAYVSARVVVVHAQALVGLQTDSTLTILSFPHRVIRGLGEPVRFLAGFRGSGSAFLGSAVACAPTVGVSPCL